MDLVDFLQQLIDQGMGITGKHSQYAINYQLQYEEEGNCMYMTWQSDEKSADHPDDCTDISLYDRKIGTIADLYRAAIGAIDDAVYEEESRLLNETMIFGPLT